MKITIRASAARALASCERGLVALELAIIAPVLLALMFGIVTYSLYFVTVLGVRHAAAEGARAAMAGLSTGERSTLAQARVTTVAAAYGALLSPADLDVTAEKDGTGLFRVRVTYDMGTNSILRFGAFLPMPSPTIEASVVVTNGSY